MSKAARRAAEKREAARLFPPGFWDKPQPTPEEQLKAKVDGRRLAAKTLRDLAARGMNRHRYTHEAAKLDAQADALIANRRGSTSARSDVGCTLWLGLSGSGQRCEKKMKFPVDNVLGTRYIECRTMGMVPTGKREDGQ
jgi:hypothetical protein